MSVTTRERGTALAAVSGVVIVADRAFVRSALGMAFAAFGRQVPVLYSGAVPAAALASVGDRHPIAAIVVVDEDTAEQRARLRELVGAGMAVTVLLGAGAPASVADGLPVAAVVSEHAAQVQDVVAAIVGGRAAAPSLACTPLPLSDMQRRVLAMFATGSSLTDIAKHLGVRPETVRTHLKRVRARYLEVGIHLPTRRDLYQVARMSGLVA